MQYCCRCRIPPGGVQSTFASGFGGCNIEGLAFDSAGNLFVAQKSGIIIKITPGGAQSTFASGLYETAGLAFDSAGNLFVAEYDSGNILEFTPDGVQSTFASGLNSPIGLAFQPVQPYTVQYTANPTNGVAPLTVQFTAASVDSKGNAVTSWNWNFGDGSISTTQNPSHIYTTEGSFVPSLIATNNLGFTVLGFGPSAIEAIEVLPITVDGTRDSLYGAPLSTQTINTGFGDSTVGDGTSAGGSELDAAYGIVTNGMLYLFFAGNLEDNGNHINVFIADGQAGQNTLNVVGGWTESAMNGSVFSPGFNASLILDFNDYYGVLYADEILLSPSGSTNSYLGSVTLTSGFGSISLNGLRIGFNNRNALGANGNTGTAADSNAVQTVSTGLELGIPLSVLGNPAPGSSILVLADINGASDSYLSDQFLPGLPVGTGDLGGGGPLAGSLQGAFNLSGLPSEWFSVTNRTSMLILTMRLTGTSFVFTWSAMANRTYQIQSTAGLAPANWTNLGGTITATNAIMTVSEPAGLNSQQFYRVVLLP